MKWNDQQGAAITAVHEWMRDPRGPQVFRLFGYAGTGKTTIAKAIREGISGHVPFAAFTGKASLVLRSKGCDGASTLHSLIYKPERGPNGTAVYKINRNSIASTSKLIIVDECSMVDEFLGKDLLSFGTRILVLGDPFQLPPVRGEGFFTQHRADAMLTDVRRQAEDNPIIYLSMLIREQEALKHGIYGDTRIIHRSEVRQEEVLAADAVLVGLNNSRVSYNRRIRHLLGFDDPLPMAGDRLICLRNDHQMGLINGGMFDVDSAKKPTSKGLIEMRVGSLDDQNLAEPFPVACYRNFFENTSKNLDWKLLRGTQQFDYGRAITTHKAQGSQYDHPYIFDESSVFRENADRWLYTALTRAAERATLVLPS